MKVFHVIATLALMVNIIAIILAWFVLFNAEMAVLSVLTMGVTVPAVMFSSELFNGPSSWNHGLPW